jgi:CspA family cold shock protein
MSNKNRSKSEQQSRSHQLADAQMLPSSTMDPTADQGNSPEDICRGTVQWFDPVWGGYGRILQDNGTDVFVHFSAILGSGFRSLEEGQRVWFDLVHSAKGPEAKNVVILSRNGAAAA